MTQTVKKMVKENNEKRLLLTEGNNEYYSNFLTYVRSAYFKDERAVEDVLLEMLDHLLLAQKEGKIAEDVFGKNPKELADDVISNLPNESWKDIFLFGIELLATLLAAYTIIVGLLDIITKQSKTIYVGNVLIIVGILVVTLLALIFVTLQMLKKESFSQKKSKAFYVYFFLIIFIGSVGSSYLGNILPPIGQQIDVGQYGMFSIGCLLTLVTFLMKKIREQR